MPPITELHHTTMTAVVNNIKSPNQFLKRLLWGREVTVVTETIQIETKSKGREIAPFVRKNGQAVMVGRSGAAGYAVEAPNIRLKMPLSPSELLYNRQPGGLVFNPSAQQKATQVQMQIAEDLQTMGDMVTNAEEYLCAQALRGVISYEAEDQEVFTITFPKPAANNVTLTTFWDDADPTAVRIGANIIAAKQIVSEDGSPALTDMIMGSEATSQFLELAEAGHIKLITTQNGIAAGAITFLSDFSDDGVMFLGMIGDLRIWSYTRTANLNGTTVDMIRPKYVEFISRSRTSDRVMYYGAIPDMKALRGKRFVGKRFSKSWEEEDPSVYYALVHSRPLPVPRRPGATVSMKVISG